MQSDDVAAARDLCGQIFSPVSLTVLAGPERFRFSARLIRLGPITFGEIAFGAPVLITGSDIGGYHVDIPITGHKRSRHSGADVLVRPDRAAVYRPVGAFRTWHSPDLNFHALKIERAALETELETLLDRPIHHTVDFAPTADLMDGPARSWSALVRMFRDDCEHPRGLVRHPLTAERMWRALISGLLFAVPHRYSEELYRPVPPARPRSIRRAIEAIRDEPHRPFRVTELAQLAGTSVRSLQEGFRRHVGMSPTAYLQYVRLTAAHEQLRFSDPRRTTVAAVAHRWGFAHLGRFAQAYRQRFGVSPSITLRKGG